MSPGIQYLIRADKPLKVRGRERVYVGLVQKYTRGPVLVYAGRRRLTLARRVFGIRDLRQWLKEKGFHLERVKDVDISVEVRD